MLKTMRELLRDEQGFTLIELMVVIVILGILAGIGIPTYQNFVKRAYQAEVEVAARTLKLGLELYRFDDDDNKYPDNLETVQALIADEDYISDWPTDAEGDSVVTISKYTPENGSFTLKHAKTGEKEYTYTLR